MSRRAFAAPVFAVLIYLPASLAAQSKFEGSVTMKIPSQQGSADLSYSIKGDKVRMDATGMGGISVYMIHDPSTKTNQMVMPSRKMYMEMPQMAASAPAAATAGKAPDIKMTGKKETIAGYECEHAIVTDAEGKQADVCGAKGLGSFAALSSLSGGRGAGGRGAASGDAGWEKIGGDFFPLKVQKVGGEVIMEVTKIEKKSVDDSVFQIPSDFQKMSMGMGRPPQR